MSRLVHEGKDVAAAAKPAAPLKQAPPKKQDV